nr:6-phosphogluconolactonase [uncultured Anaeromusa sp.]
MKWHCIPDASLLFQETVVQLETTIRYSLQKENRPLTLFLSGGSTPLSLYQHWLTSSQLSQKEWRKIHFFWGDERIVLPQDSRSNAGSATRVFLDPLGIPLQNIHYYPATGSAASLAERHETYLRSFFNHIATKGPDILILGMGIDGHTASLFPYSRSLHTQRWCVDAPSPIDATRRLTLTLPFLNRSKHIFLLAAGSTKHTLLKNWPNRPLPPAAIPAYALRQQNLHIFCDLPPEK